MLKNNKEICTEIILGIIVDIKETTQNASKIITAEYKVDDQIFMISKELTYKKNLLTNIFSIKDKVPKLGNITVGSRVIICYNPQKPHIAYIVEK